MTLPSVPAPHLSAPALRGTAAVSRTVPSLLSLLSVAAGVPLAAQREAVLKQIAVPHNYYYREMYLPQATSGPSAVAWLPDGRTLVFSMQGSLWRQRIGEPVAEQLTTGPGYAYQPDATPDGGRIVYSVYLNDQVELRVLDLQTLTSTVLVQNGAVNVEPRWAPDGRSIAFVSTAYEGRFHVWLVAAPPREAGGQSPAEPVRITPDVDSGLPRYYYSRYDHYLHPAWSPDGAELLLVSNRGKIWGSGGIWRMPPRSGGELTPVHDEESTWRMRPDWAPDGRRILYSSYLGRQWHQLWLTLAEGGDPFQLTYGEFDITAARWAPDGRRIAYISNETGNTSLWVMDVPGGSRQRIEILRRSYREPMGTLRISVVDGATGRPVPARVSVTLPDGRSAAPDDAWRHADDSFDRTVRKMEYGYFHTPGTSRLDVPAGEVTVEVNRGPEYGVARQRLSVPAGRETAVRVPLRRLLALPGWTSGDLHVHMNYGGHYRASPATLAFQARAEGLNLVENLIVNKEDRVPDVAYFTGKPDQVSTPDLLILHDQEYHTSFWGHTGLLGLTKHLVLPDYAGYAGTAAASLFPDNATVSVITRAQGGLLGYVHPFDWYPDPHDSTTALTHALPVDAALGMIDYFEVVGFSDHLATSKVWYQLLNSGFKIPAGAGTDAMTNFASLRGPVGTNRVYVQSPVPLSRERWYAALKAGKSFATNGPLLQFLVGGTGIGGELKLARGTHRVAMKVTLRSYVPVDHLQIIGNGEVVAEIPLRGDRTSADTTITIDVAHSGWYLLRAYAQRATDPVLDLYPFGTTSPVYVTVGAEAPRSNPRDIAYFLDWISRVERAALAHAGWNASQEKREVMGRIQRAREVFEARR
jgi:Tol biopolymer transport system component